MNVIGNTPLAPEWGQLAPLFSETVSLNNLRFFAKRVKEVILQKDHFCLWLKGSLGAGKTTFTRELFFSFGLDTSEAVTSPTFTIIQEYNTQIGHLAHMDFYRVGESMKKSQEFGLLDHSDFRGLVIEWGEYLAPGMFLELRPTHFLEINPSTDSERDFTFYEVR
jgi:tRNA threonylcarbamoyladenosine biosynthesis protein TsaE